MERLTYENNNGCIYFVIDGEKVIINDVGLLKVAQKLKEYEDLEEQGLLLRLPCKVRDKLYRLDSVGFIISDTVHSIHILQDTAYFEMNYWNEDICLSAVGKTIFTTQAEAEHYRKLARLYSLRKQKLKDKENNKDNE